MELILPVLLLGLMASLSPTTIIAFLLLLATARPRVNAIAFLIGWAVSLTVVFCASYALGGTRATQRGGGHTAVEVLEVLLGLAAVGFGVRAWHRRDAPRPDPTGSRGLADRVGRLSPRSAALVGVLEQPWTITAAAAVVVVHHHAARLATLVAFAIFTLVSTATIGLIFLYYSRRPGEAETRLAELRDRVVRAGPAFLAAVLVLVGLVVSIDGLIGLLQD